MALVDVARSTTAASAARVNAARVLDEIADKMQERENDENGGEQPDLSTLTIEQLEALADKIRLQERTIEGTAVKKP